MSVFMTCCHARVARNQFPNPSSGQPYTDNGERVGSLNPFVNT
jgi:hypothetical protein